MSDREVRELLDALRRGPVGLPSPEEAERARAAMLPWLEEQVAVVPRQRARHARSRQRRTLLLGAGGLLAVAAASVFFFTARQPPERNVPLASASSVPALPRSEGYATLLAGKVMSGSVDVLAGSRLGLSSRVETGKEGGATLRASDGYELSLSPESELAFRPRQLNATEEHRELRLYRGVVTLSVSPLPEGSTLSVLTDDAKVTVVGTRFSVESQAGESTCVRVSEGTVQVERAGRERRLGAGDSWGCEPDEEVSLAPRESVSPSPAKRVTSPRRSPTTLQAESRLLSTGISRERQGRTAAARRAYEELLRKYPRSSFAQDARAGLLRLRAVATE